MIHSNFVHGSFFYFLSKFCILQLKEKIRELEADKENLNVVVKHSDERTAKMQEAHKESLNALTKQNDERMAKIQEAHSQSL